LPPHDGQNGVTGEWAAADRSGPQGTEDHAFALQLELARREAGLSKDDLARAVFLSPRTIRRYLSGERRPDRATVVLWEQACGLEHGTLTALYDGRPTAEHEASARQPSRASRSSPKVAAILLVLALGFVAVLLLRSDDGSKATAGQPAGPFSTVDHRFRPAYVGDVWVRVAATPEHVGEDQRITLQWGSKMRRVVVRRLGNTPLSLVFRKTGPDDTPLHVILRPSARIAFGQGEAPDAAPRNINAGWT
jgi:transcriptional regulator with XRE-family HTH domain